MPISFEAVSRLIPWRSLNKCANGMAINLINKPVSTAIKVQNRIVRAVGFNQSTYSIKRVTIKYNKPMAKNKMVPFTSSLV